MSIEAASPEFSATVTASAGSGKTWLLVSRLVRLLLDGAEPGGILALTFTRKAAGEMKARLAERLQQLALADADELDTLLNQIGAVPDSTTRQRARHLYEQLLFADFPVRSMTFHSFCQDILGRFPLEAGIPPGFELIESSGLLEQQAMQLLFNEATLHPDSHVAHQLEQLLELCNSIENTRTALKSFLNHRSDWWAYTEDQPEPITYAGEQLQQRLKVDLNEEPYAGFFEYGLLEKLSQFVELYAPIAPPSEKQNIAIIHQALENYQQAEAACHQLRPVFLKQDNKARSRSVKKKYIDLLGEDGANQFVEIHYLICDRYEQLDDVIARQQALLRNTAWYQVGERYLQIYQQIKYQLRSLDFTDLEWRSYQLLTTSESAHWIQYKLDQRIDHFLIDEFQDTNPTQWHLLQPLLEELAAGEHERHRSIFIVGDEKQSIYGFRRANPELQGYVSNWLQQQMAASAWPLNKSWRSSAAIIDTVNAIFTGNDQPLLENFPHHGTHRQELPGHVELHPLFEEPEHDDTESPELLRNPLKQARLVKKSVRYEHEARWIAEKITDLIDSRLIVGEGTTAKAIAYDDITILVRNRTHVDRIEQALRDAGIPFTAANRGTLLDSLEIQDMEMLLDTLITPYNDLAIAQVLKSPIFGASDNDLLLLSDIQSATRWFERLSIAAESLPAYHPISRANRLLNQWRQLADSIPVHDLLDRIYSEANLVERYVAATPPAYQARVRANLLRFLELALDLDSGRYPSLMHFIYALRSIKRLPNEAPDEAPSNSGLPRVNIMTIHASKGLEAAVVFLANCAQTPGDKTAHKAMVHWPARANRPETIQLLSTKQQRDSVSDHYVKLEERFRQREDMNLLYVALTRAKQFLFISGSMPSNSKNTGWYEQIQQGMQKLTDNVSPEVSGLYSVGELNYATHQQQKPSTDKRPQTVDPALSRPLSQISTQTLVAPSRADQFSHSAISLQDEEAQTRGIAIHRALELLTQTIPLDSTQVRQQLSNELGMSIDNDDLQNWLQEATTLIEQIELQFLFDESQYKNSFNELPVLYQTEQTMVHGIIDRVVISDNIVYIVDYKTHVSANSDTINDIAAGYQQQLKLYAEGIQQVWPDHRIKPLLLFTHCGLLHAFSD